MTSGSSRTLSDGSDGDLETIALFNATSSLSSASVLPRLSLDIRLDASETSSCGGGLLFCDTAGDGSLLVMRDVGRTLALKLVALASPPALTVCWGKD